MKNLVTRICLALALIITVYNFFIIDQPVEKGTGVALLLLIIAITFNTIKTDKQMNS
ncbi:hypothetical protein [Lysinibacillus sp. BW-2-10]|uniref:hypothetical protein n=1 Tax=Lysinibacillus sp. BW-2-10 TaxID=2590030 RepID=UPI0016434BE1|nr:hypothetical protein [Lysinibacillus sp. BW-2-10]